MAYLRQSISAMAGRIAFEMSSRCRHASYNAWSNPLVPSGGRGGVGRGHAWADGAARATTRAAAAMTRFMGLSFHYGHAERTPAVKQSALVNGAFLHTGTPDRHGRPVRGPTDTRDRRAAPPKARAGDEERGGRDGKGYRQDVRGVRGGHQRPQRVPGTGPHH